MAGGGGSTVRVTVVVCGLLVAAGSETVTDPLYVPGVNPVKSNDTVRVPSPLPLGGPTDSQPLVLPAVQFNVLPPMLVMDICSEGTD